MKVTWTEVPLAGTNFQTAPHPSGSISLAPAWVPVGLLNLTTVNGSPWHNHTVGQ